MTKEDMIIESAYKLKTAIDLVAFKGKLPYAHIGTENDFLYQLDTSKDAACYVCNKYTILINTANFQKLNIEEQVNLLFHEMIHYQNEILHLEDTQMVYSERHGEDIQFHNDLFRLTAENHGGECSFDPLFGWIDANLTPTTMKAVKDKLVFLSDCEKERRKYGFNRSMSKRRHRQNKHGGGNSPGVGI